MDILYSLALGAVALIFSIYAAYATIKKPRSTPKANEVADAIRSGSSTYLLRQAKVIGIFVVIVSILLSFMQNGVQIALAFIIGAVTSYITAWLGMNIAVRSNVRTAKAAEEGTNKAFFTAILGGSVTGFAAVGFGLISISLLLYYLTVSKVLRYS